MPGEAVMLECYGDDIEALADEAGDFDPGSKEDTDAWWLRQWQRVAQRLGWSQSLEQAVAAAKQSGGNIVGLRVAPLNAFNRWVRDRRSVVEGPWDAAALARVRHDCVVAFRARPNTWLAEAPAWDLPHGACTGQTRAFASTARPSYYRRGEGTTPRDPGCRWEGEVRLSFGLFPYVSGRLGPVADGLSWTPVDQWRPASEAMRMAAELWEPTGNARQDARLVADHWRDFVEATRRMLEGLPDKPTTPGGVYRVGARLAVHLGSEAATVLPGPRGPLAVSAYNYVVERFAAFFACRRSILTHFSTLSIAAKNALRANPDPCVGSFTAPAPGGRPGSGPGVIKTPRPSLGVGGGIKG